MTRSRLATRIVVFFVALLALVQGVALYALNRANTRIAQQTLHDELSVGERVFARQMQQNRRQLEQAAGIMSADFAFREAIATKDVATVNSVLTNHGARVGANAMMVVSLDKLILVDTLRPNTAARPFPFSALLKAAEKEGKATGMHVLDARLFQWVVVPVLAPEAIAWVAMGFAIDDRVAQDLKATGGLDVSFLSQAGDGTWRMHATTLQPGEKAALLTQTRRLDAAGKQQVVRLDGEAYQSLVAHLEDDASTPAVAVLQRALAPGLAPFERLRNVLTGLGLAGLLAFVAGSVFIARRITRPVNALAAVAKKVQQGDYSQRVEVAQQDEIGALAASFNHMTQAIAAREEEILRLAYQDGLTALPNRALFNDRLEEALELAQRGDTSLGVLMMDLDRFKHVNDTLGHHVGDLVLIEVAARLRALLRASDTVARLGGDEFAVLLPNANFELVNAVARNIGHALETPILMEGQPLDVGTSIGIALYPRHGADANTLMRHADVAMYQAKREHAGFAFYDPGFDVHRQEHLSLLGELRRALEQGELQLHFQPKVELPGGRVVAAEALVRWRHPLRGMVSPGEFVLFAENTGYIRNITRWVLNAALRQASLWLQQDEPLGVSINITARDLTDREFPSLVADVLRRNRVPPELVCLEITESALMEDTAHGVATIMALRKLGLSLAIDDYGTGYSSLMQLQRLAVSELKIDRSFVHGMATDARKLAIVQSTIDLAHNLKLKAVAEGVESDEELLMLGHLGCDQAQGYFIGRPMDAERFAQWRRESEWAKALPVRQ